MYALLLRESSQDKRDIMAGFYSARRFSEGIAYVQEGHPIHDEVLAEFRSGICRLLEEILDPATPFVQNPDPKAYEYSPFADWCHYRLTSSLSTW
jgi:hypothetical protein